MIRYLITLLLIIVPSIAFAQWPVQTGDKKFTGNVDIGTEPYNRKLIINGDMKTAGINTTCSGPKKETIVIDFDSDYDPEDTSKYTITNASVAGILVDDTLNDGDFEGTYVAGVAPGWEVFGSPSNTSEATPGRDGTGSAQQFTSDGSGSDGVTQDNVDRPTMTIGKWYRMGGWVKGDGAVQLSCGVWYGSEFMYFSDPVTHTTLSNDVAPAEWTYYETVFMATGTSLAPEMRCYTPSGSTGGTAWMDDFWLSETVLRPNYLNNADDGSNTVDDPRDAIEGTHSWAVTAIDSNTEIELTIELDSPVDFTGKNIGVWVKVDTWHNDITSKIYFHSGTDIFKNHSLFGNDQGYEWSRWNIRTMHLDEADNESLRSGAPTWNDIDKISIKFGGGGSITPTIHLDKLVIWEACDEPMIIVRFDGLSESHYIDAKSYMDKYGYKGLLSIEVDNIGESGKMTLTQLRQAYADGWEISPQGYFSDANLDTDSIEDKYYEIVVAQRVIQEEIGRDSAMHMTYPSHDADEETLDIVKQFYDSGSGSRQTFLNVYPTYQQTDEAFYITSEGLFNDNLADVQEHLNNMSPIGSGEAYGHGLLVVIVHDVENFLNDFKTMIDDVHRLGIKVVLPREIYSNYNEQTNRRSTESHNLVFSINTPRPLIPQDRGIIKVDTSSADVGVMLPLCEYTINAKYTFVITNGGNKFNVGPRVGDTIIAPLGAAALTTASTGTTSFDTTSGIGGDGTEWDLSSVVAGHIAVTSGGKFGVITAVNDGADDVTVDDWYCLDSTGTGGNAFNGADCDPNITDDTSIHVVVPNLTDTDDMIESVGEQFTIECIGSNTWLITHESSS